MFKITRIKGERQVENEITDDLIYHYVHNVIGGMRAELLIRIDNFLQSKNYTGQHQELLTIISLDEDSDTAVQQDRIEECYHAAINSLLNDCGIFLQQPYKLTDVFAILQSVYEFDKADDMQYLEQLLSQPGTCKERFSSLVAYLQNVDEDEINEQLNEVQTGVCDKIQQVITKQISNQIPDEEIDTVERFNGKYVSIMRDITRPSKIIEMIEEHMKLGESFEFYFEQMLSRYKDQDISREQMAKEYVGCSLASGESTTQLKELASERLENYYDNIKDLQKVLEIVNKYAEEIENETI